MPGGYVFQSRNPWFFGPSHRYRVNEIEKAQIADCIRETLRRIKRFVFIMMVVIPLALVAGIFWLAAQGMATVGPVLLYARALFVPVFPPLLKTWPPSLDLDVSCKSIKNGFVWLANSRNDISKRGNGSFCRFRVHPISGERIIKLRH